ncbi:MAG: YihY/virulence factor BrkB family protein [candidate division Zixibacteria bacterium]
MWSFKKIKNCLSFIWNTIEYYSKGIYNRTGEHHIFLLASGLSFSIFICIIPLALIVFAVLGSLFEQPSIVNEINGFIDRVIPYKDYAEDVKLFVFARLEEFKIYRGVAGIIGSVGLLFASSGLFSSMRTILNMVFRARRSQSVLIGKLHDLGLVILVLVFFLLSVMIIPAFGIAKRFADKVELLSSFRTDFIEGAVLLAISFVIIAGAFYLIYFLVPNFRLGSKIICVGALSAALLWHIAERLFGYYISNFITLKLIYGTYAFLIVLAFWIFYTSLVFILGAEIGQLYRERH